MNNVTYPNLHFTSLQYNVGEIRVKHHSKVKYYEFTVSVTPSGRTMALGLTQRLTEMSNRNISWG